MRFFMALLLVASVLSGCDGAAGFGEGPGTSVPWPGVQEETRLQDLYIGAMCEQAGLPVLGAPSAPVCDAAGFRPTDWGLIVQAGMNDIDLRCDEYLAWLDERKRFSEPILKELAAVSAVTEGIMQISGTGAASIAITGLAFGLTATSFTNFNSRLLFEIDHSAVQAIVLRSQNTFRDQIRRQVIDNRPAAVYALRSYLRTCMPFTLQTQINNTIVLFERGGVPALVSGGPLIDPSVVGVPRITDVNAPLPAPRRMLPRRSGPTLFGPVEPTLKPAEIKDLQQLVGLPPTGDLGPHGSDTRKRLVACVATLSGARPSTDDTLLLRDVKILLGAVQDGGQEAAKCGGS